MDSILKKNIHTAISYYNKVSLQGNSDAIYRLGSIYANGYGVSQDLIKAFHLYTKSFSMGNEDASDELKIERSYGLGDLGRSSQPNTKPKIPVDRVTRINMLEKATEQGFTGLQYQLGVMYERDNNHQKAFEWLSRAAEIGVTDACFRLGTLYEEGRDVEQNHAMAAEMYRKATEKEHEDACYQLGRLSQYANGVPLDYLESYPFYEKAADMGHVKACKILSIPLGASLNSSEDTELSSQEWQDSLLLRKYVAEHGDTEVQFKVGFDYEHETSEPNYVEACKWYSMAAKSSHQKALYHLGLLYEKGFGVSQDYHKAIRLYDQANQQSNGDALYRLGIAYHYGKGVEVDLKRAVEYYKYAAEQGKPEYQCQLGLLYEKGELVEKNLLESLKWYTKAYIQGYNTIRPRLFTMYEHKPYEDYFFEKLVQNLSIASFGHFRLTKDYMYKVYNDLNCRIGTLHAFGLGTENDFEKAWEYFSKEYVPFSYYHKEFLLFLRSNALSTSEKKYILNTIEQDEVIVRQMDEEQLYALGMHFLYGVKKVEGSYITFTSRHRELGNSSQEIVIEKNYLKAFKHLKKVADNNHDDALFQLGIMYHCGYGVEKNMEQGEKCFDRLIKIDRDYIGRIGNLYHTHNEMQNFDKALEWYTLLKKRPDERFGRNAQTKIKRQIQLGMGLLYEFGNGVKQNYQKAFNYYKKLADRNRTEGLHRLALMHYYGKGVPVDFREAFNLLEKSCSGSSFNGSLPFVHYQIGLDTNGPQKKFAYRMVETVRIQGENYYYLGLMHRHEQGVLQDEEKARGCFKLAVGFGCERTKYELFK
jgi:TPR repeat protein